MDKGSLVVPLILMFVMNVSLLDKMFYSTNIIYGTGLLIFNIVLATYFVLDNNEVQNGK